MKPNRFTPLSPPARREMRDDPHNSSLSRIIVCVLAGDNNWRLDVGRQTMIPAPVIHAAVTAFKAYGVFCLTMLTVPLICAGRVVLTDAWKEWRHPK